jgi:hypothetical protein
MRSMVVLSLSTLLVASATAATQSYGKPLKGLAPTPLASILEKPEDGKVVALEGVIKASCQEKGCWLTLEQGDLSIHVAMEDHAFSVPKDSMGQKAKLEGRVVVKERPKMDVEHLEGEGAKKAGAKVSIEATGVVIERSTK